MSTFFKHGLFVKQSTDGIINKKDGSIVYDWVGTYAEWVAGRAQQLIPDSYICFITND